MRNKPLMANNSLCIYDPIPKKSLGKQYHTQSSLQETIQQLELMLLLVDRKQTEPNVTLQGHKLERSRSLVKINGPTKFLDDWSISLYTKITMLSGLVQ